jgi:hypothetical protein
MYLDAGREITETAVEHVTISAAPKEVFEQWKEWRPAQISHHGRICCEYVREWVGNTDFSALNGGKLEAGPRWIRQRFEWGPGKYPIYWCEILKRSKLDCGVHATLAHEAFTRRGIKAFRTQLVQEFSPCATAQWRSGCDKNDTAPTWIGDDVIYHEGCSVVGSGGRLKLWDSSAGWWIDPNTVTGYGSLRAVRIVATHAETFQWGNHLLQTNEWTSL